MLRCLEAGAALLVAPTGAGKTVMGAWLCRALSGKTAWVTHTQDLVTQSAAKLREWGLRVGVIAAGYTPDPFAQVQVVSIQTAVAREVELRVENLFLDEAHHFMATDWRAALDRFHARKTLGATATPERADGKPLGDIFDELVVAASYSELIAAGHLVPARVLRPSRELQKGIALKPEEAWLKHCADRRGFGYCRTVKEAEELAAAMGDEVSVISQKTEPEIRKSRLEHLAAGRMRLLWNVYALTEGVDVPPADVALLARKFGHVSLLLQSCGRVLRPFAGKREALIIDLPGMTHRLGLPVEDREYSLSGEGIRRTAAGRALALCMACGMTFAAGGACPRCGHQNHAKPLPKQRIFNEELRAVYSGQTTPEWAKRSELARLRKIARDKGLPPGFVRRAYEELFSEPVPPDDSADSDERRAEFDRLAALAKKSGHNHGWIMHRYKAAFGAWPPNSWVRAYKSGAIRGSQWRE